MAKNGAGASPGRPLTRRGRETRQRIVAAAELMFENGVAETTLEDIRAAAGVSASGLASAVEWWLAGCERQADDEPAAVALVGHRELTLVCLDDPAGDGKP